MTGHPEIRCLIFTSYTDDESLLDAILAGASGYLIKSVKAAELVFADRLVERRGNLPS
jgi:two-component system response regulator DevR